MNLKRMKSALCILSTVTCRPIWIRQFIQQAQLRAGYKFAVLTYGARKCDAVEIWDHISRKAGNAFDYIATIVMVDNWLPTST